MAIIKAIAYENETLTYWVVHEYRWDSINNITTVTVVGFNDVQDYAKGPLNYHRKFIFVLDGEFAGVSAVEQRLLEPIMVTKWTPELFNKPSPHDPSGSIIPYQPKISQVVNINDLAKGIKAESLPITHTDRFS